MKKVIAVSLVFIGFAMLFIGCGAFDGKAKVLDLLHSTGNDDVEVYFWYAQQDGTQLLSADEFQSLTAILNNIEAEDLIENKGISGSTPEYGLRLVAQGQDYYINQSIAPEGQSQIQFGNKQWWIKSADLDDFMCFLLENR